MPRSFETARPCENSDQNGSRERSVISAPSAQLPPTPLGHKVKCTEKMASWIPSSPHAHEEQRSRTPSKELYEREKNRLLRQPDWAGLRFSNPVKISFTTPDDKYKIGKRCRTVKIRSVAQLPMSLPQQFCFREKEGFLHGALQKSSTDISVKMGGELEEIQGNAVAQQHSSSNSCVEGSTSSSEPMLLDEESGRSSSADRRTQSDTIAKTCSIIDQHKQLDEIGYATGNIHRSKGDKHKNHFLSCLEPLPSQCSHSGNVEGGISSSAKLCYESKMLSAPPHLRSCFRSVSRTQAFIDNPHGRDDLIALENSRKERLPTGSSLFQLRHHEKNLSDDTNLQTTVDRTDDDYDNMQSIQDSDTGNDHVPRSLAIKGECSEDPENCLAEGVNFSRSLATPSINEENDNESITLPTVVRHSIKKPESHGAPYQNDNCAFVVGERSQDTAFELPYQFTQGSESESIKLEWINNDPAMLWKRFIFYSSSDN
ncbi:uncharacterized protein PV09_05210 [Verruconis gallopava]|uniref:Uncharacterized protein n=1 Tax=Verruconis gallopava TaxID=253628 RepID=A0A0D2AA37_9PEZI|nr:uncharacterized protein PV09_05210 [Verruconis gallopava]KIW03440.1 hypothetical protein PV09_05210 [Verruconis gallopava]